MSSKTSNKVTRGAPRQRHHSRHQRHQFALNSAQSPKSTAASPPTTPHVTNTVDNENTDGSDDSSTDVSELETVFDSKIEAISNIQELHLQPQERTNQEGIAFNESVKHQHHEEGITHREYVENSSSHGDNAHEAGVIESLVLTTIPYPDERRGSQHLDEGRLEISQEDNITMDLTYLSDGEDVEPLPISASPQPLFHGGLATQVANTTSLNATSSESKHNASNSELRNRTNSSDSTEYASRKRKWSFEASKPMICSSMSSSAIASAQSRAQHIPGWMKYNTTIAPTMPQHEAISIAQIPIAMTSSSLPYRQRPGISTPTSIPMKRGFMPTWQRLLPLEFLDARKAQVEFATERKYYVLSILNVNEFTISGASVFSGAKPTSVRGLRTVIRQLSNDYGKAVFEPDDEADEGGKWRIPLGAYQAIFSYLTSLPRTSVEGIPQAHLNIAMLGRQRLEKGYPSVRRMIHIGVPMRLAHTLAPFQRGGVDFVYERHGRALIADEMGLGKTIQAIASIALYHQDWPVLVLTPSGARYHWQNEFLNWLGLDNNDGNLLDFGKDSEGEDNHAGEEDMPDTLETPMPPLLDSQINVLTSGGSPLLPNSDTRIVIVSYGLAPKLVEEGKLVPGMFKCAIVDESHMLKNKNSKRTKELVPVLSATARCILLSGTPAFARPLELWPQINILGSAEDPSLTNEADFVRKYVKGRSKNRLAELHTVLTGTLMIRRMKNVILKQLPPKVREQAVVDVLNDATREEFRMFLEGLREGNGALAKIASESSQEEKVIEKRPSAGELLTSLETQNQLNQKGTDENSMKHLNNELNGDLCDRRSSAYIHDSSSAMCFSDRANPVNENAKSKKAVLIQMYKRTGQVKIPLVAEMLKMWLGDPAKGKLCIFAHHISVLNEIASMAGLSNEAGSAKSFIRIDGATNPRQRQDQINAFQKDPKIRVALLGITAAGVAVTLTASSTVWFAELFWTPALLLQAEDRCHRIGQQAKCRCLYIVARGTLDEILWKHVEKKFRDLGEFVEGKEKMKIVVHKRYLGTPELMKSLEVEKIEFYQDDDPEYDQCDDMADALESELYQDIEELEREEQEMLRLDALDDEEGDGGNISVTENCVPIIAGTSETEAICLSDDEGEEDSIPVRKSLEEEGLTNDREFPDLKLYGVTFPGPMFGLDLAKFRGRIVVKGRGEHLLDSSKPDVGDILLACNDYEIPPNPRLPALLKYIEVLFATQGHIDFLFAEDEEFRIYFTCRMKSMDLDQVVSSEGESSRIGLHAKITSLPTYKVEYNGLEDYGFHLDTMDSFIFVSWVSPSLIHQRGQDAVPSVGDVFLAINGVIVKPGIPASQLFMVLNNLRARQVSAIMTFAAADEMIVTKFLTRGTQAFISNDGSCPMPSSSSPLLNREHEVIDLLND